MFPPPRRAACGRTRSTRRDVGRARAERPRLTTPPWLTVFSRVARRLRATDWRRNNPSLLRSLEANTAPAWIDRCGAPRRMGRPAIDTWPRASGIRPASARRTSLAPEPTWPAMATISPPLARSPKSVTCPGTDSWSMTTRPSRALLSRLSTLLLSATLPSMSSTMLCRFISAAGSRQSSGRPAAPSRESTDPTPRRADARRR